MADSTLGAIRTKIRRITRSPSTAQITDVQIDEYVNTFIQYDFPEHLRLFSLRETFTFYTTPNVDTYSTVTAPVTDPLFNFKNRYITVHPPIYVAGYQSQLSQSRNEFYSWWPFNNNIATVGTGDGVTVQFTGTITSSPLLQNNVVFGSQDANGNALVVKDIPYQTNNGNLVVPNQAAPGILDPNNDINYITGVFTVTFVNPPAANVRVTAETVPYQAALPRAMLYFNDEFVLRPVPDKVYPVQMEVFVRPSELLVAGTSPELEQWWQYIAYGASKKIFEDRSDPDSVQQIMPEFKQQEQLVLHRTVVQYSNERTATIYTDQLNQGVGPRYNFGQGGF